MTPARPQPPRHVAVLLATCAACVVAIGVVPASAQISAEQRLCLADYMRVRNDTEKAIPALRECAEKFPESYQIQRTFGSKLAEVAREGDELDVELAEEATLHLGRAAELEPSRFAEQWMTLGSLCKDLGRTAEALAAYERAESYVTPSEQQLLLDDLWAVHRELQATEQALAIWERIWHRHAGEFDDQLAAGLLYLEVGKLEEAKEHLQRASELRPDDQRAKAALVGTLTSLAGDGTAADKKALIEAHLPKLDEADVALLERLLVMALDTFRPEAAQAIGAELLERDPAAPLPNLVEAERLAAADDAGGAIAAARSALDGDLTEAQAARAHAIIGRALAAQAYAGYASAGDKTSKALVDRTTRRYRSALTSLRRARRDGASVERDIASAEQALARLGGAQDEYQERRTAAQREACERLGPQARLAYDRDKPLRRSAKGAVSLAASAGGAAGPGTIPAGTRVALRDAAWSGGTCWVEVRADDGTSGWARSSRFGE